MQMLLLLPHITIVTPSHTTHCSQFNVLCFGNIFVKFFATYICIACVIIKYLCKFYHCKSVGTICDIQLDA